MASTKEQLLSLCADELPEATVKLDNGVEVIVRALKGSDTARAASLQNIDQKLFFVLPKGMVDPVLTQRELQKLVDKAPSAALAIFGKIMEISGALGEEEREEKEDAKKN